MSIINSLLIFITGLCVGSFLNVVIIRLHARENLGGSSRCPQCSHKLAWFELIPVFSFVAMGAKCRYCRAPISMQYPAVEIATGVVFLLISIFPPGTNPSFGGQFFNLLFWLYIASSLIVIFVYDLKHFIIPDIVLFPAIAIALFFDIASYQLLATGYLAAAALASGFFLVIYLISGGRWIGFGDVKLAILLGLLLGWPHIIVGILAGVWLGAAFGIISILSGKKSLKSKMPFAPFLICGAAIALIWGNAAIQWYAGFLV